MERGGSAPAGALTWLELDAEALKDNVRLLKRRLPASARLAVAVKSNAYGHGLELAARAFIEGGADWLCVHSLSEASALRAVGLEQPIYVFGPTAPEALEEALALKVRLVMYSREQLLRLAELSRAEAEGSVKLHLKVETGNNRQGLPLPELLALAEGGLREIFELQRLLLSDPPPPRG